MSIWTQDMISNVVIEASWNQRTFFESGVNDYWEVIYKYVVGRELYANNSFVYLLGHSLGSGVSQIVSAKVWGDHSKRVLSLGISGPGASKIFEK